MLVAGLFVSTMLQASQTNAMPAPAPDVSATAHFYFALAKLHVDAGDFEEALAAYEKSIELDGSDPYSYLETAKFYGYLAQVSRTRQQTVGYLDKSLELLTEARARSPENPDILRLFAETHLRLGEERPSSYAVAQGALEKLRELEPSDIRTLVSLGQIYLFSRDSAKAADVLSEASSYSPRNRMVLSMLVDALLGSDRKAEAEKALTDLIPLDPGNAEHSLKLANLLSERGENQGAVAVLEAAGDGDWLTGSRINQALAREYHLVGEHEKALLIINRMLEDPFAASAPNRGLQRLKTSILTALARYREAAELFVPLLENEDNAERRLQDTLLLSRLYERTGDFDKAVELLSRESASLPVSVPAGRIAVAIADVQERGGDVIGAETTLRRALENSSETKLGPESVDLTRELAVLLSADDRPRAAAELLEKSLSELASQPPSADPAQDAQLTAALQLNLAGVYGQLEDWARMRSLGGLLAASDNADIAFIGVQVSADALAEEGQLEKALALVDGVEGRDRQVRAKKVELLHNHDRPEEAERLARESAEAGELLFAARLLQRHELYPASIELLEQLLPERSDTAVLFSLGAAYERTGAFDKAVETFQRLLEAEPGHSPSLNYLGYMWTERGENLEQSLEMIQQAVAADPDNGAYVDSLGWVYYQLEKYEEARPHLEWAARLSPDDSTVHEHLGDLYVALGDIAKARKAYRRSLELRPDSAGLVGEEAEQVAAIEAKLDALERVGDPVSGTDAGLETP